MEKWMPCCGREAESGFRTAPARAPGQNLVPCRLPHTPVSTAGCRSKNTCVRGSGPSCHVPRALTSPIFCTRLSVVYPEYVVLSTAGSR